MISKINNWPLKHSGPERKGSDLHPQGHCERYLCPYEPNKEDLVPCQTKADKTLGTIATPCPYNPRHLPPAA